MERGEKRIDVDVCQGGTIQPPHHAMLSLVVHRTPSQKNCSKLHRFRCIGRNTLLLSDLSFAVEPVMDTNERQIALSVLESLRNDLMYAHLNNGSRILEVADLRQYIYEQMNRIRTDALAMYINKGNGHASTETNWRGRV
jgi:hypothetical protein